MRENSGHNWQNPSRFCKWLDSLRSSVQTQNQRKLAAYLEGLYKFKRRERNLDCC